MSNSRPREVLSAAHTVKDKGPPIADGTLSVTADASEAMELCSRRSALDFVATTSTYLEDDNGGLLKPSDLYGKVTWRIERFSETTKRELRSNVFEIGQYKWYILVYPHGCDVCNHLSLFLCVADYDRLLPGWSHFAQFTIAVVNKDPKKSKYSDTLHRFCKKEHDWGWKKFMELTKVLDGFAINDTLTIKAQVQVIRDCIDRPFRCLEPHYRQELVRVYLSSVESVCRRFVDQRRELLASWRNNTKAYAAFWESLSRDKRNAIVTEAELKILRGLVKRFFNEREVTSTLVMDAIFCGCRQIEERSRQWLEGSRTRGDVPGVILNPKSGAWNLEGDALAIIESVSSKNSDGIGNQDKDIETEPSRNSQSDESIKDGITRDEIRLAELGRKMVEMYVISHIFTEHIEIAYQEAECLKRQEELLREEEEVARRKQLRKKAKADHEREKKAKRLAKKKVIQEEARKQKEEEESERLRRDEEKKKAVEKKRTELQEQRRVQKEKLEKEYQEALAVAKKEAEARQRQAHERRQELETQSASNDAGTNEKPLSPVTATDRAQTGSTSQSEQDRRMQIRMKKDVPSPVTNGSQEISSIAHGEEIKRLQTKVRQLEVHLKNKDLTAQRMQHRIEYLLRREKELKTELAKKAAAERASKKTPPTSESASPSSYLHETELAKGDVSRERKLAGHCSTGSQQAPQGPKNHASTQTGLSSRGPRTDGSVSSPAETGQTECRSHSSGDETCSDGMFVENGRCLFQTFTSVDPSQTSDSATHETRSISSFGTQLDHVSPESELIVGQEVQKYARSCEAYASCGLDAQRAPYGLHPTGGKPVPVTHSCQGSAPLNGAIYPPQRPSLLRANSIAACTPMSQQSLAQAPIAYTTPGAVSGRSYSLDATFGIAESGMYPTATNCQEFGTAIHEPFELLPDGMQSGVPPGVEYFVQNDASAQADLQRVCDSSSMTECSAFDDFAHFSMIKDLLE